MSPPPERNGSPKCRAIWPVHSRPMPDSGVPNVGEPDCMSMLDRNDPKITGAPGRISWESVIPDRASAICCTRAAGMVTGDIAPISRNGVSTDRIVGFEGLGFKPDSFTLQELEQRLLQSNVLLRSKMIAEDEYRTRTSVTKPASDDDDDWD